MKEFKCDKYTEIYIKHGWDLDKVSSLIVSEEDGRVMINACQIEGGAIICLNPDTAAKFCQEILKITGKIQGFEIVPPSEITAK